MLSLTIPTCCEKMERVDICLIAERGEDTKKNGNHIAVIDRDKNGSKTVGGIQ